jgi:hypothetical protein
MLYRQLRSTCRKNDEEEKQQSAHGAEATRNVVALRSTISGERELLVIGSQRSMVRFAALRRWVDLHTWSRVDAAKSANEVAQILYELTIR